MYLTLDQARQKLEQVTAISDQYTTERRKLNADKAARQSFLDDATLETPALDIALARVELERLDTAIEQLDTRYASSGQDISTALNRLHELQDQLEGDRRLLTILRDVSHLYTKGLAIEEIQYQASMALQRLRLHGESPEAFSLTIRA